METKYGYNAMGEFFCCFIKLKKIITYIEFGKFKKSFW